MSEKVENLEINTNGCFIEIENWVGSIWLSVTDKRERNTKCILEMEDAIKIRNWLNKAIENGKK